MLLKAVVRMDYSSTTTACLVDTFLEIPFNFDLDEEERVGNSFRVLDALFLSFD